MANLLINRRKFLGSGAALAASGLFSRRLPAAALTSDPLRPQFHLLPAHNWMNDPNGPIYVDGQYHMFFQYNPLGPTWGNMSWNHAVSPDMVHWRPLPLAMTPTPDGYDSYGVFSGSALQVGKRVYAVYTGTKESTPALATIAGDPHNVQESQCLAWSDLTSRDAQLIHWTKAPQPILPLPPPGMVVTGFRDPSIWRQGDWFYMTVGSGEAKVGGCVLLYRSKSIDKDWEYLHKLTSGTWTGTPTQNPCDDGEMWECPDFFALDGRHVLIYSTLGKVFWQSGKLDEASMLFHPEKTGLLDLDAFYAPKTQLDAKGRRILWGWIPERRSEDAMRAAGWSGMMSLPRVLTLDADGNLRMTIAEQLHALREAPLPKQESRTGISEVIPKATGELLCTGTKGSAFTLSLNNNANTLMKIRYAPDTHSFFADDHEIKLQPNDAPTIHAYIDGSVLEVILGERIGYSKRFYYTAPTAPDIDILAAGPGITLNAWPIEPISPNRLTTQAR